MTSAIRRCLLGFLAAAISVLVFHQAMWEVMHLVGLMPAPYPTDGVPPFGVPRIINLCFWGGLWGAVFGLLQPVLPTAMPIWLRGLGLGIIAALVSLFVIPTIKGLPVAGGWQALSFLRSFVINGFWGVGVGLILWFLLPSPRRPGSA